MEVQREHGYKNKKHQLLLYIWKYNANTIHWGKKRKGFIHYRYTQFLQFIPQQIGNLNRKNHNENKGSTGGYADSDEFEKYGPNLV